MWEPVDNNCGVGAGGFQAGNKCGTQRGGMGNRSRVLGATAEGKRGQARKDTADASQTSKQANDQDTEESHAQAAAQHRQARMQRSGTSGYTPGQPRQKGRGASSHDVSTAYKHKKAAEEHEAKARWKKLLKNSLGDDGWEPVDNGWSDAARAASALARKAKKGVISAAKAVGSGIARASKHHPIDLAAKGASAAIDLTRKGIVEGVDLLGRGVDKGIDLVGEGVMKVGDVADDLILGKRRKKKPVGNSYGQLTINCGEDGTCQKCKKRKRPTSDM